jgi:hypothetical protein
MFARLLASICLINLGVGLSFAGSNDPADAELVVYLKAGADQPSRPIELMKRELGSLMHSIGHRLAWQDSRDPHRGWSASFLVVVELHGSCGMPAGSSSPDAVSGELKDLASTSVVENAVLPFSQVNCAHLTRMLAPALAAEAGARRDFLYGRAMARVLAHELYHVIARTSDHMRDGIAKPCFGVSDLLSEGFAFEQNTVSKLQHQAPENAETPVTTTGDLGGGR